MIQARSVSSQDVLNYPARLDAQLLALLGAVTGADAPPTAGSVERFDDLRAELDRQLVELQSTLDTELALFNALVGETGAPAVIVPRREERAGTGEIR